MSSKENKSKSKIDKNKGVVAGYQNTNKQPAKAQEPVKKHSKGVNSFLWLLLLGVISALIFSSQYYAKSIPNYLNLAVSIGIVAIFLLGLYFTNQGKVFFGFVIASLKELRKIHWPTRSEVLQTTLIVIAITVIVSFAFWILDSIITIIINKITTWKF